MSADASRPATAIAAGVTGEGIGALLDGDSVCDTRGPHVAAFGEEVVRW